MVWLVFSNLYVACCGAALTAATYPLLGVPARLDAAVGLVFAATLVVYNLDRLVDPHRDNPAVAASPHERWVARHRPALWLLTIGAGGMCTASAFFLDRSVLISLALPACLALGYCLPVLPGRGGWRRLKAVPGAKLLLIGGVWTYATAVLPAVASGLPLSGAGFYLLVLGRFLFVLAVALPFDLPDTARDRASGIATLPQRCGAAGTRSLSLVLIAGFTATACLHPWPWAAGLIVSGGAAAVLLAGLNTQRGAWYYGVGLDGLLPIQAALVLVADYARSFSLGRL